MKLAKNANGAMGYFLLQRCGDRDDYRSVMYYFQLL
ncbi:MAG: hypothetical protein ACJAU3_000645 [Zhongshania sp.]|jgi:hypothetical protein